MAILTNTFVPCNGRFPTLIAILTMFFIGTGGGAFAQIGSALLLTGVILLGVGVTFAMTKLLSKTLLKGIPSSFTLELPPYRKPQIGKVLVRSVFDRMLASFGGAAGETWKRTMNGITGTAVCLVLIFTGVHMIVRARKELHYQRDLAIK